MFALAVLRRIVGAAEERGSTPTPPLLIAALLLKDNADIEVMNQAGATLIGWHDAKNSWALRAASTGGTHFLPVQDAGAGRPVRLLFVGRHAAVFGRPESPPLVAGGGVPPDP